MPRSSKGPLPSAANLSPFHIKGTTRITGIFADPSANTLSPRMHNFAFMHLNLDYVYVPFGVRPEGLKGAVDALRALNIAGVNVTIPHKRAIMPLLDELSPAAQKIGAVNTVVNKGGRLIGHNTDAPGFMKALKEDGRFDPRGKQALMVGAGGVAYAMAVALAEARVKRLVIMNRTLDHARELASHLKKADPKIDVVALRFTPEALRKELRHADLLLNATPTSIDRAALKIPADDFLSSDVFVFDAIYAKMTSLLMEAKNAGARSMGGLEMLAHQGALAFSLWTGAEPPVKLMRRALEGTV